MSVRCWQNGTRMADFSLSHTSLARLEAFQGSTGGSSPCWDKSQHTSGHGSTFDILKEMKVLKTKYLENAKPLFCVGGAAGGSTAQPCLQSQQLLQLELWDNLCNLHQRSSIQNQAASFPGVVMLIFQNKAAGAVPECCGKTSWQILLKGDRDKDSRGFKRPLSKVRAIQEF